MKVSFILSRVGLAALGALALAGAAAPVRAEGGTSTPYAVVEGLVVKSTDVPDGGQGTLVIHQAIGGDVTLNTNGATRFRKAGGQVGTPDEYSDGALVPAVQKPSPAWFVGLFARATYNKANSFALDVALTRPEPLPVTGVVSSASQTEVVLTLERRGDLHLTLNGDTACRMSGLPAGDGNSFHPGDLAEALFWLTPDSNEAIRLAGRSAPAQRFEGTLGGLATADGAPVTFTLTRGASSLNFTVDGNTKVLIDGKPGSFAGLQNGWTVAVVYRKQGDVNLALGVTSFTPRPKPVPPTPKPNTGGDKGKGDGDKGQGGNTNTGGDTNKPKPPTPPAPKPVVVRPVVVEGVVSVKCDGSVFQITKADGSVLSFGVDAKTAFRLNDKTVACSDLAVGQHVHVVFLPADKPLAMYVLIHVAPGSSQEHGSGGGAGTPAPGTDTQSGGGGGAGAPIK